MSPMNTPLCIFESPGYRKLLPLVHLRPVWELRLGIFTLRERMERAYPRSTVFLHCRDYLAPLVRERGGLLATDAESELRQGRCLFVNGAAVASADFARLIPPQDPHDAVYISGEEIVAARVSGPRLAALVDRLLGARGAGRAPERAPARGSTGAPHALDPDADVLTVENFHGLPRHQVDVPVIRYPWELARRAEHAIVEDFEALGAGGRIEGRIYDGAHLCGRDAIHVGEGSTVWPSCVLDGESGPVYIGRHVTILPGAVIRGPVSIGDSTVIKPHAEISEGTSIGPVCKVGGEVEATILQGYANKQHTGFLGHSFVAEWVNLGAGTNNSDLKNNYGHVRVRVDGQDVDTGEMFVGLTMGDHSKSGINSMFNTGTVVGVCCNIFGAGFPPKYVPAFSWGGAAGFTPYDLERAIEVARRVMARRKVELTPGYEHALRAVFALTGEERQAFCAAQRRE